MYTTNKGDSDYKGESFSVTFPAGVNVITFNVPIINDNIAELAESFTLDLVIPPASTAMGVIAGSPDTATVNIMDDEGQFNAPQCRTFPGYVLFKKSIISLNVPLQWWSSVSALRITLFPRALQLT